MAKAAERRLREILGELSSIGAVLPGSISRRWTRCQRPGCHCRVEPYVQHGPYHTWTWRTQGVPVTKTLTDEELERLRPYSEAHRRLKHLLGELERISLELIEQTERIELGRANRVGNRRVKAGK